MQIRDDTYPKPFISIKKKKTITNPAIPSGLNCMLYFIVFYNLSVKRNYFTSNPTQILLNNKEAF